MKRLVRRVGNEPAVPTEIDMDFVFDLDKRTFDGLQRIFNQLCDLTDILGDDYDLDRLRELMNQRMTMREDVAARRELVGGLPMDRLCELVKADRDGRCVIVTRCSECKNHSEVDGEHYCKFWRMYCPNDSEFYCKAALKGERNG